MRYQEEYKTTTNTSLFKRIHKRIKMRYSGKCTICPPHGGENATRTPGHTSWKSKNKRKKQYKGLV